MQKIENDFKTLKLVFANYSWFNYVAMLNL